MRVDHHTSVKDVRMEIDNGRVISRATLLTCVNVSANKRTRCLGASYVTDEEYLRDESVLTVYYPDPGESLFEIAKRYHTSVRTIAESNRLTEAVFSTPSAPLGVSKLIIK